MIPYPAKKSYHAIHILGFDIGGTKTGIVLGDLEGKILVKDEIPTPIDLSFEQAFGRMAESAERLLQTAQEQGLDPPKAISVSVGGPLDVANGVINSPPHLPNWKSAPLKDRLSERFGLPVFVEHDGNAGALAEFYFGAGQGVKNMIYLTLGTGLGAGLILDGRIYHGTTDTAGEIGHVRLSDSGPDEYGKSGSWEGLSSGAGLAKLARWRDPEIWPKNVSTYQVVQAALEGEPRAVKVVQESGRWLGRGLAILVDILNPEVIVMGTLGVVLGDLLLQPAREELDKEALPIAAQACRLAPANLGGALGNISALMAAIDAFQRGRWPQSTSPVAAQVVLALEEGMAVRQRTIQEILPEILAAGERIVEVLKAGCKILIFGNGGSAASAQHFAGELIGHYRSDRSPLQAISLTADSSVLTCIANDYSFEDLYARQVQALAKTGDLVIGLTTSGRSKNVIKALQVAASQSAHTLALTGEAGLAEPVAEQVVAVPSPITARVQEEHDAIIHVWCDLVEMAFSTN